MILITGQKIYIWKKPSKDPEISFETDTKENEVPEQPQKCGRILAASENRRETLAVRSASPSWMTRVAASSDALFSVESNNNIAREIFRSNAELVKDTSFTCEASSMNTNRFFTKATVVETSSVRTISPSWMTRVAASSDTLFKVESSNNIATEIFRSLPDSNTQLVQDTSSASAALSMNSNVFTQAAVVANATPFAPPSILRATNLCDRSYSSPRKRSLSDDGSKAFGVAPCVRIMSSDARSSNIFNSNHVPSVHFMEEDDVEDT